jgi:hypothetical protein
LADASFPGGPRSVGGSRWARRKLIYRIAGIVLVAALLAGIFGILRYW